MHPQWLSSPPTTRWEASYVFAVYARTYRRRQASASSPQTLTSQSSQPTPKRAPGQYNEFLIAVFFGRLYFITRGVAAGGALDHLIYD